MPKYMFQSRFVGEGVKGLLKEGGSSRLAASQKAAESMGGKVEAFYFAFGDVDSYTIAELPDNVAAAALSVFINSTGNLSTKVTVLMTPEEMDAATRRTPSYRAPGQ